MEAKKDKGIKGWVCVNAASSAKMNRNKTDITIRAKMSKESQGIFMLAVSFGEGGVQSSFHRIFQFNKIDGAFARGSRWVVESNVLA